MNKDRAILLKVHVRYSSTKKVVVNCELKTERDTTSLDCAVVNKQPKDRNVQTKLKPN